MKYDLPYEIDDCLKYTNFLANTCDELKFHIFCQRFILEMKNVKIDKQLFVLKVIARHLASFHYDCDSDFELVVEMFKSTVAYTKYIYLKQQATLPLHTDGNTSSEEEDEK